VLLVIELQFTEEWIFDEIQLFTFFFKKTDNNHFPKGNFGFMKLKAS